MDTLVRWILGTQDRRPSIRIDRHASHTRQVFEEARRALVAWSNRGPWKSRGPRLKPGRSSPFGD